MFTRQLCIRPLVGSFLAASVLGGCIPEQNDDATREEGAVASANGLHSINGLKVNNGLDSGNGLHSINGLKVNNGLSSTEGLMTSTAGRETVEYLVRCALPAGVNLVKADQYGANYTFKGSLGLAPAWETGACDGNCQELVSACMMAHVNTAGIHVPLWVVADVPNVGWGLDPNYPNQEGSFFGNIFMTGAHGYDSTKVAAFYCYGRAYDVNTVPGRIGADQIGAPYTDPFLTGGWYAPYSNTGIVGSGACTDYCTAADY